MLIENLHFLVRFEYTYIRIKYPFELLDGVSIRQKRYNSRKEKKKKLYQVGPSRDEASFVREMFTSPGLGYDATVSLVAGKLVAYVYR